MPTQHVEPDSEEYLQDVANAILKARKVVVVTGAGISTNSGIPDFRSENGLYSLIQAQFDAAARRNQAQSTSSQNESESDDGDEDRAPKRRRTSREGSVPIQLESELPEKLEVCVDTIVVASPNCSTEDTVQELPSSSIRKPDSAVSTPRQTRRQASAIQAAALQSSSPLSSPPCVDGLPRPTVLRRSRRIHPDSPFHRSSSPLSSPPPALSDPFDTSSCSTDTDSPSRRSSTSASSSPELDDTQFSVLSQGRNSLPNMKGKDLFDVSVWADPLRTSVFYTFATSLRQKVRDAEPTTSHRFISHLRDRGKLVRCYTQNIDLIEEKVGLSTRLQDGPGSRGRFSRRSTANSTQLNRMVEELSNDVLLTEESKQAGTDAPELMRNDTEETNTPTTDTDSATDGDGKVASKPPKLEATRSFGGVECVTLHGSLEGLRCFLCGRVCNWDDARESETLSGQQPECPHCVGATAAREERGKRALGVGKLRPDIVLYGEEHPHAHLISPVVTHDLSLNPDVLLILGTSLRVHGLKILVREFAKAIHNRGGKVVFVNFTKPPESSWGDTIDYWVQWDCDAWVSDLQSRVPKLWEPLPPPRRLLKKTDEEKKEVEKKQKPPAANPVALRDTKATGAYWVTKCVKELHRITASETSVKRATTPPKPPAMVTPSSFEKDLVGHIPASYLSTIDLSDLSKDTVAHRATRQKSGRPRKSNGPAGDIKAKLSSTLNPNHGRATKADALVCFETGKLAELSQPSPEENSVFYFSSILSSVKVNSRIRKRKRIDGEEVVMPVRKSASLEPKSSPTSKQQTPKRTPTKTQPRSMRTPTPDPTLAGSQQTSTPMPMQTPTLIQPELTPPPNEVPGQAGFETMTIQFEPKPTSILADPASALEQLNPMPVSAEVDHVDPNATISAGEFDHHMELFEPSSPYSDPSTPLPANVRMAMASGYRDAAFIREEWGRQWQWDGPSMHTRMQQHRQRQEQQHQEAEIEQEQEEYLDQQDEIWEQLEEDWERVEAFWEQQQKEEREQLLRQQQQQLELRRAQQLELQRQLQTELLRERQLALQREQHLAAPREQQAEPQHQQQVQTEQPNEAQSVQSLGLRPLLQLQHIERYYPLSQHLPPPHELAFGVGMANLKDVGDKEHEAALGLLSMGFNPAVSNCSHGVGSFNWMGQREQA